MKDYTGLRNRPKNERNESETYRLQMVVSFCNMTSDFDSKTQGTLKESIVCHMSDLFRGLRHVPGEISIKLKRDVEPVAEPCRKVPVGKFKALEEEFNRMEENDVITKIEEPTDWVNSLHLVYKQDRSLRVCLDPRNVYKAIRREHFKLPTREEIMAKCQERSTSQR